MGLARRQSPEPPAPPARACVIVASDFYLPVDAWRTRLAKLSAAGASGALLMIADPAEEDFPFAGRMRFYDVGGHGPEVVLGRAEHAREAFAHRLAQHRRDMRETARSLGFLALAHRTDHAAAPILATLVGALSERG
jgi:uncharacterized protein (DUF58 family)